jgi:hypothetical protein
MALLRKLTVLQQKTLTVEGVTCMTGTFDDVVLKMLKGKTLLTLELDAMEVKLFMTDGTLVTITSDDYLFFNEKTWSPVANKVVINR